MDSSAKTAHAKNRKNKIPIRKARLFDRKVEAEIERQLYRLMKEFGSQPIIDVLDIWIEGFKTWLKESGGKQNMTVKEAIQAIDNYFFWIESLLKTCREDGGVL